MKDQLTHTRLFELLDYNSITGIFTNRVNRSPKSRKGDIVGHTKRWTNSGKLYTMIGIDNKSYLAHRLAWFYINSVYPERDIFHIDGNGTNNSIDNLKQTEKISKDKEQINQKELKKHLHYDPETGEFTRISVRNNPNLLNKRAGYKHTMKGSGKVYIDLKLKGHCHRAHRLAFLYMTGSFPKSIIDHIDGDDTNNKWSNLRDVSKAENNKNVKLRKDNKSGQVGVYFSKDIKKWKVEIGHDGDIIRLGSFTDKQEAIRARKLAEKLLDYHQNHGTTRKL